MLSVIPKCCEMSASKPRNLLLRKPGAMLAMDDSKRSPQRFRIVAMVSLYHRGIRSCADGEGLRVARRGLECCGGGCPPYLFLDLNRISGLQTQKSVKSSIETGCGQNIDLKRLSCQGERKPRKICHPKGLRAKFRFDVGYGLGSYGG